MAERVQLSVKKPEAKRENKPTQTQKTGLSQSISSPVEQILFLQRTIGNQAVGRLIKSGALQTKLKIGLPGDKYEQEADRVAEQVMRMKEPQVSKVSGKTTDNPVQRQCPRCTKKTGREEEEKVLQAKEASDKTPEVTPEVEHSISSIHGGGQPLPESVRAFYEPRFGHDFRQVRVHTDAKAAKAALAVNARAFTMGQDVVFGQGEYSPRTTNGQRLLAHEMTHVIQQGHGLAYSLPSSHPAKSALSGTILRKVGAELNYDQIVAQIHKAISGWGTDEEAVYLALQKLQRNQEAIPSQGQV
jgi:hypothetical protein